MSFVFIVALIIAIAVVLFILQNPAIQTISFLSFQYSASLALIVVVVFALGIIAGILVSIASLLRNNSKLRELKKRAKQLEETIARGSASSSVGQEKAEKH